MFSRNWQKSPPENETRETPLTQRKIKRELNNNRTSENSKTKTNRATMAAKINRERESSQKSNENAWRSIPKSNKQSRLEERSVTSETMAGDGADRREVEIGD